MEFLIEQSFTYDQISMQLKSEHPNLKGLSSMSVRRFCKKNNIGTRKCQLSSDEIKTQISKCALEVYHLDLFICLCLCFLLLLSTKN